MKRDSCLSSAIQRFSLRPLADFSPQHNVPMCRSLSRRYYQYLIIYQFLIRPIFLLILSHVWVVRMCLFLTSNCIGAGAVLCSTIISQPVIATIKFYHFSPKPNVHNTVQVILCELMWGHFTTAQNVFSCVLFHITKGAIKISPYLFRKFLF